VYLLCKVAVRVLLRISASGACPCVYRDPPRTVFLLRILILKKKNRKS
jgi:hypothetical protein